MKNIEENLRYLVATVLICLFLTPYEWVMNSILVKFVMEHILQ